MASIESHIHHNIVQIIGYVNAVSALVGTEYLLSDYKLTPVLIGDKNLVKR